VMAKCGECSKPFTDSYIEAEGKCVCNIYIIVL